MRMIWKGLVIAAVLAVVPALADAQQAEALPRASLGLEPVTNAAPARTSSGGGVFTFDFEAVFLRFHQEGGVTDADGFDAEFDLDFTPRFEIGFLLADGLGVRGRYWRYDHSAISTNLNAIDVETTVIDLEAYRVVNVGDGTTLEISGGARLLDYDHSRGSDLEQVTTRFDGWGLTVGLTGRHQFFGGEVYAKARWSVLMEDIETIVGDPDCCGVSRIGRDHVVHQIELGIGYERAYALGSRAVLRVRGGLEFQQWLSLVAADTAGGFGGDDHFVDVGFGGLIFGVGLDW